MLDEKKKLMDFPVQLKLGREWFTVCSKEHYKYLNDKANKLYQVTHGYRSQPGFDYYCSNHPQECGCFFTALIMDVWCSEHDFNQD